MIESMNEDAIVFAMANPVPEIRPELALKAGAKIIGTGSSGDKNQINNVLAFPGVFKGALDAKATKINHSMELAAARALAECIKKPAESRILPNALDKKCVQSIAKTVKKRAIETGVVRE